MRASPPTPGTGQTAALVLFANLGDLLLLEPCIRWLHQRGVIIDLFCPREIAMVWEDDPRLRRIIPLRSGNQRYERTAGDRRIPPRRDRYDFLFDFRPTGRSYRLVWSLHARHRCTWRGRGFRRLVHAFLYNVLLPPPDPWLRRDRHYLTLLGLVDSAADPWVPARTEVNTAALAAFRARHRFFRSDADAAPARRLLLQPTARWKRKLWTVEGWRTLIARLQSVEGNRLGIVCGPDPREVAMLEEIARDLIPTEARFPGTLKWADLRTALAAADLFIGLDSAPYHLAAMLDKPLVVLFGPTDARQWGPQRPHQLLVQAPESPSGRSTSDIPLEQVLEAIRTLLPAAVPSPGPAGTASAPTRAAANPTVSPETPPSPRDPS